MRSDDKQLVERLTLCGWTPEAYLRLNPDVKKAVPANLLPEHFLIHGLRESRPFSDLPLQEFHFEGAECSGRDFVVYGWSKRESEKLGILLVKEVGKRVYWDFVEPAALWFWRDDVAKALNASPKTARNGVVMAGNAAGFDLENTRIYVFAHGSFTAFKGLATSRASARQMHIECFRLLESLHVHKELLFLLTKYPKFLEYIGQTHEAGMASVPVTTVYSKPNPQATYAICAVALGNPQMLKAWLMSLPDQHDLAACEVNILCNGPDQYDAIMQAARWFGQVLGGCVRLLYAPENVGFNVAVNRLVQTATPDYVMVTNIDVQYRRFDLQRLIAICSDGLSLCAARQFNGMGAVQHLSLDIQVNQDMVHGEPFVSLESKLIGRNTYLADDATSDQEVQFFGAACFFGKRSLLAALGPFSPKFLYAYHEDSDMALRARSVGVRLVVTDALDLVHFESSGSRVDLPKSFFIAANSVRLLSSLLADQKEESVNPSAVQPAKPRPSVRKRGAAVG